MKLRNKILAILGAAAIGLTLLYQFAPGNIRRSFTETLQWGWSQAVHYDLVSGTEVFNIRQVMTTDPSVSRVVMWQSNFSEQNAVLELRNKKNEDTKEFPQKEELYNDAEKETYIHTVQVSGLTPGEQYEYRIRTGKKATSWMPMTAFSGDSFKAMIFPDSQSSDYTVWKQTADAAWQRNPDATFFINMGDLVDNGQDASQWNAWFGVVQSFAEKIPAVTVMGNHETYTLDWKVRRPEAYMKLFSLPKNGYTQYPNRFYSYDVGDVHFVVIDTMFSEMKDFEPTLQKDEIEWFKNDMAQHKKKWNIVLMHKDPLQYAFNPNLKDARYGKREEGFSDEGKVWMPLFDAYGVDLVLSAHLHTYRNRGHIKNFVRDPAGPLYIITGVAGNVRYPELWKQHALDLYVAPQPETDNYIIMDKQKDHLTITCYLPDGTMLDKTELKK